MAQYPLGMGRKDGKLRGSGASSGAPSSRASTQLALQVDKEGRVQRDQIVRHGHNRDRIVYSRFTDLIEATSLDEKELAKPDDDAIAQNTNRTRSALEKVINTKVVSGFKAGGRYEDAAQKEAEKSAVYYRYTPAKTAQSTSSRNSETRIIRLEDAPVDPLEPPKFKVKRTARGPPSPPVPIMHSPPKKLSKEEAASWNIPAAISNWKNPGGITIALDKRLAADGRHLQEVQINDKFAKLAESLFIAERTAREDIEKRAEYERMRLIKQKRANEEKLLELAKTVRNTQSTVRDPSEVGLHRSSTATARSLKGDRTPEEAQDRRAAYRGNSYDSDSGSDASYTSRDGDRDDYDDEGLRRREEMRRHMRLEREYEKRQQRHMARQRYEQRDREDERDVTEKVALGQVAKTSNVDSIDSRLYNFDSGLGTGFGDDGSYNIYDAPLFRGGTAGQIYQPRKSAMEEYGTDGAFDELLQNRKFTKGFVGSAEGSAPAPRESGPVQFERERKDIRYEQSIPPMAPLSSSSGNAAPSSSAPADDADDDPFGFNKFMVESKRKGPLDHIGRRGMMSASGGGTFAGDPDYSGPKRQRIDFQPSSDQSPKRRR